MLKGTTQKKTKKMAAERTEGEKGVPPHIEMRTVKEVHRKYGNEGRPNQGASRGVYGQEGEGELDASLIRGKCRGGRFL